MSNGLLLETGRIDADGVPHPEWWWYPKVTLRFPQISHHDFCSRDSYCGVWKKLSEHSFYFREYDAEFIFSWNSRAKLWGLFSTHGTFPAAMSTPRDPLISFFDCGAKVSKFLIGSAPTCATFWSEPANEWNTAKIGWLVLAGACYLLDVSGGLRAARTPITLCRELPVSKLFVRIPPTQVGIDGAKFVDMPLSMATTIQGHRFRLARTRRAVIPVVGTGDVENEKRAWKTMMASLDRSRENDFDFVANWVLIDEDNGWVIDFDEFPLSLSADKDYASTIPSANREYAKKSPWDVTEDKLRVPRLTAYFLARLYLEYRAEYGILPDQSATNLGPKKETHERLRAVDL